VRGSVKLHGRGTVAVSRSSRRPNIQGGTRVHPDTRGGGRKAEPTRRARRNFHGSRRRSERRLPQRAPTRHTPHQWRRGRGSAVGGTGGRGAVGLEAVAEHPRRRHGALGRRDGGPPRPGGVVDRAARRPDAGAVADPRPEADRHACRPPGADKPRRRTGAGGHRHGCATHPDADLPGASPPDLARLGGVDPTVLQARLAAFPLIEVGCPAEADSPTAAPTPPPTAAPPAPTPTDASRILPPWGGNP
jgi:hypothetical protein